VITIVNGRHVVRLLRHLRDQSGLTRRDMAARLFVTAKTVANRELGARDVTTDVLVDTAHVLGWAVALVPQRHPGARNTGTGWPA
jgi:DNA-binding XRE family transcriptional regulator